MPGKASNPLVSIRPGTSLLRRRRERDTPRLPQRPRAPAYGTGATANDYRITDIIVVQISTSHNWVRVSRS